MREPSTGKPSGGGHPAGESQNQPFQLSFNRFLRVDFQRSRVTSGGGLLLVRELADEFAAAFGQDRRRAGETCALLLAAAGRRASHAGVFWQHAAKDRGPAVAGRVANQERQRIERSEVIRGASVSGQAGRRRETDQPGQRNCQTNRDATRGRLCRSELDARGRQA